MRDLSAIADNAGAHFEELIEIIAADAGSHAVYRSPLRSDNDKELCDGLIVGSTWMILVQAKSLDVTFEDGLADRARLRRRTY